jgi:hypothetical protein
MCEHRFMRVWGEIHFGLQFVRFSFVSVIDGSIYGPFDCEKRAHNASYLRMNNVPKRPLIALHT